MDSSSNTIEEMLTLDLQRFLLLDIGHVHIPIVIGIMEVGESVIVRGRFHPRVEDLYLFVLGHIIVDNHSPAADNGHSLTFRGSSQLLWMMADRLFLNDK